MLAEARKMSRHLHSTVYGAWTDPCWDDQQRTVFRLADELHQTGVISDELLEALAARFDEPQILEQVITAGWYHLIGYVCNATRVQREAWAPGFPNADQARP